MRVEDIPPQGLAFFDCQDGAIVIRPGVAYHINLLFETIEGDWDAIERWMARQRPRLGRIGLYEGKVILVALSKPTTEPVPAFGDERWETDPSVIPDVLRRVMLELRLESGEGGQ